MNNEIFINMFERISQVIPLDEIAYLGINEGELIPIYKKDTGHLSMEKWVQFHKKYRSFVKDSPFLTELVEEKKMALIEDTNTLPKKPVEFEVLNICSIYLFPIIKENKVIGILDIAYRNKGYKINAEQVKKIVQIAEKYRSKIQSI